MVTSARPETEELVARLSAVEDPALFLPLGTLGTLRSVAPRSEGVALRVALPPAYPDDARALLAERLAAAAGVAVFLELEELDEAGQAALGERLAGGDATEAPDANGTRANPFGQKSSATRVLAISSGKGGVGKSSVTVNLAVALAATGQRVGLLDADIYGFSVPRMLGLSSPPLALGHTLVAPVAHNVRVVSMGLFIDEDRAVAWRGPMLHKALEQFLVDVYWGPLDYLVVDLPPGTGDVPMSIASQLPGAECYVVTTPQPAAQRVAQRAGALAREVRMPVRGVIENMSYFLAPDGTRHEIFGHGGGERLAQSLGVPLLARLPLETAVREGADEGVPAALAAPDGAVAGAFSELAKAVIALGPARVYRRELKVK